MDLLQFIASVTQSLAWPIVVLVLGLVFRRQLIELLSRPLESLELGPFKARWQREINAVKRDLALLPAASRGVVEAADRAVAEGPKAVTLKQLVRIDPALAIMTAHDLVSQQLQRMTGLRYGEPPLPATAGSLARVALAKGLIDRQLLNSIEGITRLRNLVAHGRPDEVTANQAQEYVAQVELILQALESGPKT